MHNIQHQPENIISPIICVIMSYSDDELIADT